ncbi:alpha/beta hydrolase [Nocardia sp. CDC160]|uniref:alpha/beta hydrolase n=1 Tax=Nocardia sp. CDC160 TaxID=3112166 RepID=UPI002DBB562B|nr:alpha/beta hydrolase [Nocardia sp. CDC160]MEC3919168.1 alpha/beta hydrolase [Nocardia sp. CDC160]
MPSEKMLAVIDGLFKRRLARPAIAPPLEVLRAGFAPAGVIHEIPDDVAVVEVSAAGVPAFWIEAPTAQRDRVLLFVHGGGFSLGSIRSHGELAARLGRVSRARVLFPEYRLAPEHPFPAGLEDVQSAWHWLVEDQSVPPESIVLVGDSAGGNLITAFTLAVRDSGAALPAATVLLSPVLDLTASGRSFVEREGQDPKFTAIALRSLYSDYLAGSDPLDPLASPLFANLVGLPPVLIQVGTAELLLSDSERFAAAARAAGVDVTLQIEEGLPHVYPIMRDTPEAAGSTIEIAEFIRKHLA